MNASPFYVDVLPQSFVVQDSTAKPSLVPHFDRPATALFELI
jgi:hypothetical protein